VLPKVTEQRDVMLTIPAENIKRMRFFYTIVYKIRINIEEAFGIAGGNTSVFCGGQIRVQIGEFAIFR